MSQNAAEGFGGRRRDAVSHPVVLDHSLGGG